MIRRNTDAGLRQLERAFRAAPTIEGGLALARAQQRAGDNPAAYDTLSATLDATLHTSYGLLHRKAVKESSGPADQLGVAIVKTWAAAPIATDGEPRYMGTYFLRDVREISPTIERAVQRFFSDLVAHITKFWVDHGQQVLPARRRPKGRELVLVMQHAYHSDQRKPAWRPKLEESLDDSGFLLMPEIMIRLTGGRDYAPVPGRGEDEASRLHDEAMRSTSAAFHGVLVEWQPPSHEHGEDHPSPSQSYTEFGSHPFPHVTVVGRYRVSLDQGFMQSLVERFEELPVRRNTDADLRQLERAWLASRTNQDHAAFIRASIRAGAMDPARLWIMARMNARERDAIVMAFGEDVPIAKAWLDKRTDNDRYIDYLDATADGIHDAELTEVDPYRDLLVADIWDEYGPGTPGATDKKRRPPLHRLLVRAQAVRELGEAMLTIMGHDETRTAMRVPMERINGLITALEREIANGATDATKVTTDSFLRRSTSVLRTLRTQADGLQGSDYFGETLDVDKDLVRRAVRRSGREAELEDAIYDYVEDQGSHILSFPAERTAYAPNLPAHQVSFFPPTSYVYLVFYRYVTKALEAWLHGQPRPKAPPRTSVIYDRSGRGVR